MSSSRAWAHLALLVSLVSGPAVHAELCAPDTVPAATLLLPYFEVEPANPNGVTTIFSINNADSRSVLAHVTLWTDWAVATVRFDVYLTGYDVQTINLRDLFNGRVPQTAPLDRDPNDTVSPRGSLSQDGSFPGCGDLPYQPPLLGPLLSTELTAAHRGLPANTFGGCVGYPFPDGHVRGYVTVDTVSRCSVWAPSDPAYWDGVATERNVLWGSYFVVDPTNNFAQQETLVHIEACDPTAEVPGPGACVFGSGSETFYGRYTTAAADLREPLPSSFALAYLNGGAFDGGTRLAIWRDTLQPGGVSGACGTARPTWFPLDTRELVGFDEQENAAEVCGSCQVCSPPFDPVCFPIASQLVGPGTSPPPELAGEFPFWPYGWMFLNLSPPTGDRPAQAWVTTILSASGRFSVATDAVALDDLCSATAGDSTILH